MATLPFALVGGFWLVWLLGHHLSVATAVGFIALAGRRRGVRRRHAGLPQARAAIGAWPPASRHARDAACAAIDEGAVLRVRPKAMTVAVIIAGLLPIMWADGTGSEVMQRIAAPMIGGMITAPLLSMFVIPAAYLLMRRRDLCVQRPTAAAAQRMRAAQGSTPAAEAPIGYRRGLLGGLPAGQESVRPARFRDSFARRYMRMNGVADEPCQRHRKRDRHQRRVDQRRMSWACASAARANRVGEVDTSEPISADTEPAA